MISIQLSRFFPSQLLPVSIIIASNEGKVIDDHIQNSQQLAYLATKLETIIASDGSLDSTNDIARHYAQQDSTAASLPTPATGRDQKLEAMSASRAAGQTNVLPSGPRTSR